MKGFLQKNIFGKAKPIAFKNNTKNKKGKPLLSNKIQQLYSIYSAIYDTLDINIFETKEIIIFDNIIAYPEEKIAEVNGTQFLNIDERIKINGEWLNGRK